MDGRPILLLHGFPEFWWGWRHQIGVFAAAGMRVVVPDLRGYHRSDKPRGVRSYRMDLLARDVCDLIEDLGVERARIAAHDWGGAVAWWVAQEFPERVERLAILNVPHPAVLRKTLLTSSEQRRRSRYMLYFQLPFLPERKLAAHGFRAFRSIFRRSSRPGTFSPADLDRYAAAAAEPGALRAMLHWYRAALRHPPQSLRRQPIEPPVRLIWGTGDVALGPEMIEPSAAVCERCELFRLPDAGHWVTHEAADEVNRLLLDFLT
ncbi:MAG: alpha/beta hydrolase [Thermoanaerobaculia bacterium]